MTSNNNKLVPLIALLTLSLANIHFAKASTSVWIDTDAACDQRITHDVDDCWALAFALSAENLEVRGISTVFGNSSEETSYTTVNSLLSRIDELDTITAIHRGTETALDESSPTIRNPASDALAEALEKEPLTIIALGPLSNIASLIVSYPDLVSNIKRVIVVAGQRPDRKLGFYPGKSRLLHVHDFNFRKDVTAFDMLLHSPIPMSFAPFELAQSVTINHEDLALMQRGSEMSRWLSEISEPWLKFWLTAFMAQGFHPFDSLAVGLANNPEYFSCESIPVRIDRRQARFVATRDKLEVSHTFESDRSVHYCFDVDDAFKTTFLQTLVD